VRGAKSGAKRLVALTVAPPAQNKGGSGERPVA
jgi:hypothetical protein